MSTLFHHQRVENEFDRWKVQVPNEPSSGLTALEVLEIHFLIVDMFYARGEGLGGVGPKSLDLLLSAVARQDVSFGGEDKWTRIEDYTATLLFGIVCNHPFHDANKRTAFLSTVYLLYKNGLVPQITEQQFEDFLVTVAERSYRNLSKYKRDFAEQDDGDVRYISHYLKSVTRQSDKKDYFITYRELSNVLKRFGYELRSSHNNTVDILRVDESGEPYRIGNVGCHGMTKQVPKGTIKLIRKLTELDVLAGVDSGAFYRGEESLTNLLAKYYQPLERLAFR